MRARPATSARKERAFRAPGSAARAAAQGARLQARAVRAEARLAELPREMFPALAPVRLRVTCRKKEAARSRLRRAGQAEQVASDVSSRSRSLAPAVWARSFSVDGSDVTECLSRARISRANSPTRV